MKYRSILLTVLLIALAGLTACSSGAPDPDATRSDKLRIITEEFPPFNYTYQDGNLTGQSTEIVREVLKRAGQEVNIEVMPWSQGYELAQKEPNVGLYSTGRIPEREDLFKWVGPIGTEENYFYARQDSGIAVSSLEEAKKVGSIAVYRDDSNHLYLKGQGFTNLNISENDGECLRKLLAGEVDMWLGPAKALYFIALQEKVNHTDVKPVMFVRNVEWYIAFNKATPDALITLCQSKLDEIKRIEPGSTGSLFDRINSSYTAPQYAEKSISPEAVVQLVEKTARDVEQDAAGTFRRINNQEHPYLDGDNRELYIFVYDSNLVQPANADNPAQVGRSYQGVPDAVGNLFRDQIRERSLREGSGWQDFVFTRPGSSGLFYKSAYFKLVTGSDGQQYIICSGRYKQAGE